MLSYFRAPAHTKKPFGERLAIIGLNCSDTDLTCPFQVAYKAPGSCGCLVAIHGHEDPLGGPVARHNKISARRFIDHVWRVFHVHVGISGLRCFQTTVLRFVILGRTVTKTSHSMPTQTTIRTRARHIRVQKLARHGQ